MSVRKRINKIRKSSAITPLYPEKKPESGHGIQAQVSN
jgi:hypothetical protein